MKAGWCAWSVGEKAAWHTEYKRTNTLSVGGDQVQLNRISKPKLNDSPIMMMAVAASKVNRVKNIIW